MLWWTEAATADWGSTTKKAYGVSRRCSPCRNYEGTRHFSLSLPLSSSCQTCNLYDLVYVTLPAGKMNSSEKSWMWWLHMQDAPEFWISREDYQEEGVACLSKCGQAWFWEVTLPTPFAILVFGRVSYYSHEHESWDIYTNGFFLLIGLDQTIITIQFFHVSRVMLFVTLLSPQSHVTWSPQYLVHNVGIMPHGIIELQLHNSAIF